MTKLYFYAAIMLTLIPSLSFASEGDDGANFERNQDKGHISFQCAGKSTKDVLDYSYTYEYKGCDQSPTQVESGHQYMLHSKGKNTEVAGFHNFYSNKDSTVDMATLIKELKNRVKEGSCSSIAIGTAPEVQDPRFANPTPENRWPNRIDHYTWEISFTQDLNILEVCKTNGVVTLVEHKDNFTCTGEEKWAWTQYWDNGCI